jgi:hypothetical protein
VSIPALQCDSRNIEDIHDETGDGGQAFDGVTYGLQYKSRYAGAFASVGFGESPVS